MATWLLLYTYVDDMLERRGPHRDEHLARIRAGLVTERRIEPWTLV